MDGTNSNQQEPCEKHKRKKRRIECDKGVVDRLSELPDEIIYIILSFLPLRQAVSTSLLSHRWPDLWKHTSNLDFIDINRRHNKKTTEIEHDLWDVSTCKNVKMVNSVLESHKALFLKEFRIQFYINNSAQSTVTKWLEFVWSRQVERLKLKFICDNSLRHMLVLGDLLGEIRPMQHLKTLSLRSLIISGEDISLFLKNCPLLRELNIEGSHLTSEVKFCDSTLVLEELRIRKCNIGESFINISAPNLALVSVDARPGQLWLENVPRLVAANFAIDTSARYTMQHFTSAVCCITSQLETLKFFIYLNPKKLSWNGFPIMPNLKKLCVKESSLYEHGCLLPLKSMISACPCLQNFKFEFQESSVKNAPKRCPHQYIKTMKFQGSCATDIIQSMTYITVCCNAYQEIKPCTPAMSKDDVHSHREQMDHLQQHLSHQVEIKFFKSIDE